MGDHKGLPIGLCLQGLEPAAGWDSITLEPLETLGHGTAGKVEFA